MKVPTMRQRLERKISFLSLFIYLFIFAIRISRYILFPFFGVFPHFSIRIRIRDPQVSGSRFTDTQWLVSFFLIEKHMVNSGLNFYNC